MTYTKLLFRSEARESLLRGTGALADAVRLTLGPRSKSVLIQKSFGAPLVCDDGVTIAKQFRLKVPEEDMGAQLLRQAAEMTGDAVGDGTTTSTILAHALFADGVRNVTAGASAVDLRRGFEDGLAAAVEVLRDLSRPVASVKEKRQVAAISAHGDQEIGNLVAEAMEKVGDDGAIMVEDSRTTETVLEVVEGLQFDRGYISPYFVTDADTLTARLEDPAILLHEKKLSGLRPLVPLLEQVMQAGRPLLIIAEDLDDEALATLVVNRLRGTLKVVAVKAPDFGDRRRAIMEDIAALTGCRLVSPDLGLDVEKLTLDDLGRATSVRVDRESTTIVGGAGVAAEIEARIAQIKRKIEETTSDYDREKLRERLAKLSGGVAVIRAGAATEAELKSRKEALDDAISATKAAVEEGIVPGGGLALVRAIAAIEALADQTEGDRRTGVLCLSRALGAPARQIAENSAVDGGVVLAEMRKGTGAWGFDAAKNSFTDLLEAGIIDPTKVVRIALENAVSVVGTLLLTEATMAEISDEQDKQAQPRLEGYV
ncbi:chaperonin GroEL [Jannaschia seohaensis]|uniref:Chaperonin GroEL n=1 Tax=Jannaschia seohaensis TaxID=475081 RepID=A0A2Y9AKV3_9RHOB|nr:chaperonin GroEL [Jannaschia seohaensis]PWJ20580.1 chaperonin GroEL [Jannaschia seohaensis]SSA44676.1 chaperonin GroEL [Jannaschia seohaensis]